MVKFQHLSLIIFLLPPIAWAEKQCIDLNVAYKTVNFTGRERLAIAVNDQIPGPTLHFKQGDEITINVYNHLDQGTTIHWHGLLVPWQMDGVEGVTQHAIKPGCVFQYKFRIEQSGTYWYHAHAGSQEQDGLYGAIVIDPKGPEHYSYAKSYTNDHVIVLSDWGNAKGDQIFKNLKKDGDYYSPKFPLQASLVKFFENYRCSTRTERKQLFKEYQQMQQMRMSLYDLSDVAYDAYLLNGKTCDCPWTAQVKKGDNVRLRFIGAAASTIYRVKIPGTKMQMIQAQGNDVEPYCMDDFSIAPGETYDVLVKILDDNPTIIYAESTDTFGKAYGALLTAKDQSVDYSRVQPFPEPEPLTRTMHRNMMASMHAHKTMHAHKSMSNHDSMRMDMHMSTEATIIGDHISQKHSHATITHSSKYNKLKAATKTNDPNKPIDGTIRMELFGYMDRYMWFINGLPEYKVNPIPIEEGKRYRIVFTNTSMMRHPMHIHGHWFILRHGKGAYDPLLHTIEVAPGETIVADIDADASGQWFFHCHHLYHMIAGMARVFQYQSIVGIANCEQKPKNFIEQTPFKNRPIVRKDVVLPLDHSLIMHPMAHGHGFYFANYLDVGQDTLHNKQTLTFKGLYGGDYHKLELFCNDADFKRGSAEDLDLDIFYWQLLSQFWAIKGGVNYVYRPKGPYWQPGVGIEGLMPYFIETNLRAYFYKRSLKLDLDFERDCQITNNFFINLGARGILATRTVARREIGSGLNEVLLTLKPFYRIAPGLAVFLEFEYEQYYGRAKSLRRSNGDSSRDKTLSVGFSVIF